jgi:DNA-directed RNA polymerase specialized sigma24 family protein
MTTDELVCLIKERAQRMVAVAASRSPQIDADELLSECLYQVTRALAHLDKARDPIGYLTQVVKNTIRFYWAKICRKKTRSTPFSALGEDTNVEELIPDTTRLPDPTPAVTRRKTSRSVRVQRIVAETTEAAEIGERVLALRKALYDGIQPIDIQAVVARQVEKAKEGDLKAAQFVVGLLGQNSAVSVQSVQIGEEDYDDE